MNIETDVTPTRNELKQRCQMWMSIEIQNCSSKFNTREKNWISFSNSPNPEMTTIACQRRVPNPTAAPFETSIRNTSLDWKSPAGSKRGGYLSFLFWNWKKNKKNQTWSDIWQCYLRPDSDHFHSLTCWCCWDLNDVTPIDIVVKSVKKIVQTESSRKEIAQKRYFKISLKIAWNTINKHVAAPFKSIFTAKCKKSTYVKHWQKKKQAWK